MFFAFKSLMSNFEKNESDIALEEVLQNKS